MVCISYTVICVTLEREGVVDTRTENMVRPFRSLCGCITLITKPLHKHTHNSEKKNPRGILVLLVTAPHPPKLSQLSLLLSLHFVTIRYCVTYEASNISLAIVTMTLQHICELRCE